MRFIQFSNYAFIPGRIVEWRMSDNALAAAVSAPVDDVPPSHNQELHIATGVALRTAGVDAPPWIALAFDIAGTVDLPALGRAFGKWIERHETLRSGFRSDRASLTRFTLAPELAQLEMHEVGDAASAADIRAYLQQRFDESTDPLVWPAYLFAATVREDSTTVSMAFDHSNIDGYSIAMTVYEIQTLYSAELVGGDAGLPEAGSFLEFCAIERGRQVPMPAVVATVQHWHRFLRACDGTLPSFPVDLGVPAGTIAAQTSLEEMELLNARAAEQFGLACRAAGGSFVAGILAAMGVAAAELGGNDRYRTVIPLHTRSEPRWQWSLGWYINVAPIDFPVRGAVTFTEVLRGAEASFRQARTVGSAPLPEIAALLGYDVDPTRRDRFSMTSYIDARTFPGSDQYDAWAAHAIGNVSFGEEATVWITRTLNRVAVSARYPDTPTARKNLTTYFDVVRGVLLEVALTGNHALRGALPTGRTASAGLDAAALST
jgi:hypothetical protein